MFADYRGVGCETMVNHCGDPKKCMNGGICVNLAPGFRCDCPTGEEIVNHLHTLLLIQHYKVDLTNLSKMQSYVMGVYIYLNKGPLA